MEAKRHEVDTVDGLGVYGDDVDVIEDDDAEYHVDGKIRSCSWKYFVLS